MVYGLWSFVLTLKRRRYGSKNLAVLERYNIQRDPMRSVGSTTLVQAYWLPCSVFGKAQRPRVEILESKLVRFICLS